MEDKLNPSNLQSEIFDNKRSTVQNI